jgi:penicillin-binding protein 1C
MRKRITPRRLVFAALGLLAAIAIAGGAVAVWALHDLPSVDDLASGLALPATRIYDRHGELLYEIVPPDQGSNRVLAYDEIPAACRNAIVAVEDRHFFSHIGVDLEGILRALWLNLRGGEVVAGGSTITQQTVRLLLFDEAQRGEQSIRRKLREMALAVVLTTRYSRQEVLALYLNQVSFGNLTQGLDGAARRYFHKGAGDLSLAECAMLAGIVQNAVLHDPLEHPQRAQTRQAVVLNLMVADGMITAEQASVAAGEALQFGAIPFPIEAPHFVMAVWDVLEREMPEALGAGGLEVVTTLDAGWQREAQTIAQRHLERLNHPLDGSAPVEVDSAALMALDPHTGEVLTMLGSPDYFDETRDGAVNGVLAPRQPGSTLKPFTYAAAMGTDREQPFTAATLLYDIATPFVTRRLESYTPANYGHVEHGPVLLREALASSYNIPAVVALDQIGVDRLVQLLFRMGIDRLAADPTLDLAVTLGGGETNLYELVRAYAVLANGGRAIEPVLVREVRDVEGRLIYQAPLRQPGPGVIDPRIAYILTDILSDPAARIPAFGRASALEIGRPAAAKTGTTTDFRDNWVIGYTPSLVTGVWVGNPDNTPMVHATGISGAGPIWNAYMRAVLAGTPVESFARPPGILDVVICAGSGMLPSEACPRTRVELFVAGTEPTQVDTLYRFADVDSDAAAPGTGVRAVEMVLPPEAADWAHRHGAGAVSSDGLDGAGRAVRFLSPDPYTVYERSSLLPPEVQRVRMEAVAPPATAAVVFVLNGETIARVDTAPWRAWWVLEAGAYRLEARALQADGTWLSSDPLPFTVVEAGNRGAISLP